MTDMALAISIYGKGQALGGTPVTAGGLLRAIRYADPAAWCVASAVGEAWENACEPEGGDDLGLIVIGAQGPQQALADVRKCVSPLRFPAANPGAVAAVSCISFGIRGPTLNLLMPTVSGLPIAATIARTWLANEVVRRVFIASYFTAHEGLQARCLLLGRGTATATDPVELPLIWLSAITDES